MATSALAKIISRVHRCIETRPGQYQSCCPSHKGGREGERSFGFRIREDGSIVVNCFTCCTREQIMAALDLTPQDLMPDAAPDGQRRPSAAPVDDDRPTPDEWLTQCENWARDLADRPEERTALARVLGVPEAALAEVPLLGFREGRSEKFPTGHRDGPCWTYPEFDAAGNIVGVHMRFVSGKKKVAEGSRRGLAVPRGWADRPGALYLPEGYSDVIALTAAGCAAVGRPSVNGGVNLLVELVKAHVPQDRDIVWLGENDRDDKTGKWPGRDESKKAAQKLATMLPGWKVYFSMPPSTLDKDARQWLGRLVSEGLLWHEGRDRVEKFFKRQLLEAGEAPPPEPTADPSAPERVHVHTFPGCNQVVTGDTVMKGLGNDMEIYQRAGKIVEVVTPDPETIQGIKFPKAPWVQPVKHETLRAHASQYCRFTTVKLKNPCAPDHPPEWAIAEVHGRGFWPELRPLVAIVEYPFFRPDGTLVTEAGYDRATGVLLAPIGPAPKMSAVLDKAAALAAWDELNDVLVDFPFGNEYHRTAWLAGLMTPVARFAFDGPAPMLLIDGNMAGAGKGKLCNLISLILTGEPFAVTTYTANEEEMRKRMTAIVTRGVRMVLIDNIAGVFGGPTIDAVMTGTKWEDRVLGTNDYVNIQMFTTFFGTGNNVQCAGDSARRLLQSRLESRTPHPEHRDGFKYEDLEQHASAIRLDLLRAVLTILGAYFAAGKPPVKMKPWGSFEAWSKVVRAAIMWLGLPDPAEGREGLRVAADPTRGAMCDVINQWKLIDPDNRGLTCNQVIAAVFPPKPLETPSNLADLAEALDTLAPNRKGNQLGYKFRHFRHTPFETTAGPMCIDHVSSRSGTVRWGIVPLAKVKFSDEEDGGGDGGVGEDLPRSADGKNTPPLDPPVFSAELPKRIPSFTTIPTTLGGEEDSEGGSHVRFSDFDK